MRNNKKKYILFFYVRMGNVLFLLHESNFYLPEKSFEILRQLRPAGVAWIHGDKDTHRRDQVHILTHEVKAFLLVPNSILDALHLETPRTPDAKDQTVGSLKYFKGCI